MVFGFPTHLWLILFQALVNESSITVGLYLKEWVLSPIKHWFVSPISFVTLLNVFVAGLTFKFILW